MEAVDPAANDVFDMIPDRYGHLHDAMLNFQRRMTSSFFFLIKDDRRGSRDSQYDAKIAWIEYASEYFVAGYAFEEIERLMKVLEKETKLKWTAHASPLWYIKEYQNRIPLIWEEYLMNWSKQVRSRDITLEFCDLQVAELQEILVSAGPVVDLLDWALQTGKQQPNAEYEVDKPLVENTILDPRIYATAATNVFRRLQAIEPRLKKVVAALAREEDRDGPADNEGLRKRAVGSSLEDPTAAESKQSKPIETQNSSTESRWTLKMKRFFDPLNIAAASRGGLLHKRMKIFAIDQSSLWTLTVTIGIISACTIASAIMRPRQPECVPSYDQIDDGVLSLVAQVLVQLLSLYATLLPILRDRSLPDHSFWFFSMLALSAIATILSPAVYGKSWQGSTLLSYFAAVFGMMSAAHLAGRVEEIAAAHHLAR